MYFHGSMRERPKGKYLTNYRRSHYIAMADKEMVPKIAENIKAIRLKKNLTIKQLAEKTRVTKGLLSKIENSRTIPSLPVFVQILKSLDISFHEFFQGIDGTQPEKYTVIRRDDLIASGPQAQGPFINWNIVEKALPSSTFAVSLLHLNSKTNQQQETAYACRFDYVISGNCEYQPGNGKLISMGPGDSICIHNPDTHLSIHTPDNQALILVIRFKFFRNDPLGL